MIISDLKLKSSFLTLGTKTQESQKLAGNGPKVTAMCGLQNSKKKTHIFVVFKLIIHITVVLTHLF